MVKIAGVTLFFLLFSLLRGSLRFESIIGLPPCGVIYHLSNAGVLVLSYFAVKSIIKEIVKMNKEEDLTEELIQGDDEKPTLSISKRNPTE